MKFGSVLVLMLFCSTTADAQLGAAMNMYNAAEAVIALYIALGGGTK